MGNENSTGYSVPWQRDIRQHTRQSLARRPQWRIHYRAKRGTDFLAINNNKKDPPHEKSNAMEFVIAHHKDAEIIAASLNVPTEMILGLSGVETEWEKVDWLFKETISSRWKPKKDYLFKKHICHLANMAPWQHLGSYLDSGRSFALRYGDAVRGIKNPVAFAQALVRAKFNSGNSKNGGSDNFVTKTADTINSTKRRLQSVM